MEDGPSSGSAALAPHYTSSVQTSVLRKRHPQDVEVILLATRGEEEGRQVWKWVFSALLVHSGQPLDL